jgi:hypothetical protein
MARRVAQAPVLPIPNELDQPVAPTETLAMMSPSGEQLQIPAAEAGTYASLGYKQLTPELSAAQAEQAKYGEGIVNELEAAGLGILRGTTLGLSDLALRKINPEWADSAAKLKEYNPDASLAGEIGSFAIPAIGSLKALGAAGKAAKATGLLQGLVSKGGEGLGAIATKIVGENLAGRAASGAVNMAAQAAVYQAAHNISEDSLGDRDLTAESIMANVGQAALLGGGFGMAMPLAARAAEVVAGSAPVRYAMSGAAKQFAKFFVNLAGERELFGSGKVAFDPVKRAFAQVEKGGMPSGPEAYQRVLDGQKAIYNESTRVLSEADAKIAATPELQRTLSHFPEAAQEQILAKIDDLAANSLNVDKGYLLAMFDKAKAMFEAKGGSLSGLNELKKGLYDGINYKTAGNAEIKITKDIARAVKSAVEAGAEVATPGAGKAIKDLNKLYGALETIREPLDVLIQKGEANVNVGGLRWRDMLASIGGGFAGGAVGGPVGAALGLGAGVANKMLQTDTGLLLRAQLGRKLKNLAWAEQLMDKSQAEIAGSIKGFISGAALPAVASEGVKRLGAPVAYALSQPADPTTRGRKQQDWFDDTRQQILAVASNPEQFAAAQGEQVQGFADAAPGVAEALVAKQLQVYQYLANVMPKNPGMPVSIFSDKWKPADYEVQRFRKVVQVARAPLTILNDMRSGAVTADQVEAVKTLYPRIYESILDEVREQVTAKDTPLTYDQRLKLGHLFGGSEPTMSPEFVAAMQSPVNKPDEPSNRVRPPGGQVNLSQNHMSESERVASR